MLKILLFNIICLETYHASQKVLFLPIFQRVVFAEPSCRGRSQLWGERSRLFLGGKPLQGTRKHILPGEKENHRLKFVPFLWDM